MGDVPVNPFAHRPERGSDVEAFIKSWRDRFTGFSPADGRWDVLDDVLEDYRLHADTGVPLSDEVEGP